MDKTTFLSYVRKAPFGGRITPQQLDGLERILAHWESRYKDKDIRWLAYVLATVFHETAATMQPIKERGGEKYLKAKPYYPWYGRGLVQITWKENYKKYGIDNPDDALKWDTALHVLFNGMIHGKFTGKGLPDYFSPTVDDPRNARRIVNGTDKAGLIADYYTNFLGALKPALGPVQPADVEPEDAKPDASPLGKDPQVIAVTGAGFAATVIGAINSPWGVAALVVLVAAAGIGAYLYFRNKEKWTKGV